MFSIATDYLYGQGIDLGAFSLAMLEQTIKSYRALSKNQLTEAVPFGVEYQEDTTVVEHFSRNVDPFEFQKYAEPDSIFIDVGAYLSDVNQGQISQENILGEGENNMRNAIINAFRKAVLKNDDSTLSEDEKFVLANALSQFQQVELEVGEKDRILRTAMTRSHKDFQNLIFIYDKSAYGKTRISDKLSAALSAYENTNYKDEDGNVIESELIENNILTATDIEEVKEYNEDEEINQLNRDEALKETIDVFTELGIFPELPNDFEGFKDTMVAPPLSMDLTTDDGRSVIVVEDLSLTGKSDPVDVFEYVSEEQMDDEYSDYFRQVTGRRPSVAVREQYEKMTEEEKREVFKDLHSQKKGDSEIDGTIIRGSDTIETETEFTRNQAKVLRYLDSENTSAVRSLDFQKIESSALEQIDNHFRKFSNESLTRESDNNTYENTVVPILIKSDKGYQIKLLDLILVREKIKLLKGIKTDLFELSDSMEYPEYRRITTNLKNGYRVKLDLSHISPTDRLFGTALGSSSSKAIQGLRLVEVNGKHVLQGTTTNKTDFTSTERLRLAFGRRPNLPGNFSRIAKDIIRDAYEENNLAERFLTVGEEFSYINIPFERLQQNLDQGEPALMRDKVNNVRRNTRTHIKISKVGDNQYKVEGLPKEEILTAQQIREGLVRFKEMPSRVGVLELDGSGKPLTKSTDDSGYHLFREGDISTWVPATELEAYDKNDVAEMSDQMDFDYSGEVDNSLNYIVMENATTDLSKGDIIPRHKANKYAGSGVILQRYDKYLEEQEAKRETIEDETPDVTSRMPSNMANKDLVMAIMRDGYPWDNPDYTMYNQKATEVSEKYGIPKSRVLNEIDSINRIYDLTPNGERDAFQYEAINNGVKRLPRFMDKRGEFMSDPTVEDGGLQGNVQPEQNTVDLMKTEAASINELTISLAYATEEIRKLTGNPDLTVDEVYKKYLKGSKVPSKIIQKLSKDYGESMEIQNIEMFKNSPNMRDEARSRSIKKIETQIRHILKSIADIEADLDPTRPNSIEARIAKYQEKTIIDDAHLFDRSRYGDRVREIIDARVSSTKQSIVDDLDDINADIILKAYKKLSGNTKVDQEFRDSLDGILTTSKSGGIPSNKIADLILEVSKLPSTQKLNIETIFAVIRPRFNNKNKAIILSAILNKNKDFIRLARLSQSSDIKARQKLSGSLQKLSRASLDELKVLNSEKSRAFSQLVEQ
jgi:hypothetical protein